MTLPPLPPPNVYGFYNYVDLQAYATAAVQAAVAEERKWRETVDDMLVTQHEVASDDPRESINRLINWNVMVALDPCVSSDARKLVEDEREAIAQMLDAEHAREKHRHNYAAFYTNMIRARKDKE